MAAQGIILLLAERVGAAPKATVLRVEAPKPRPANITVPPAVRVGATAPKIRPEVWPTAAWLVVRLNPPLLTVKAPVVSA